MNHNGQDERMRQLFRELREQDEDQAPPFATVLDAALRQRQPAKPAWLTWRLAVAVCPLIVILFSVLLFDLYSARQTGSDQGQLAPQAPDQQSELAPIPQVSDGKGGTPEKPLFEKVSSHNAKKKPSPVVRSRQLPARNLQPALLISEWHSPTEGLLKTPGAELFKRIPQVGQPLFEMKNLFPNEKN